jgi:hypothetical protein
MNTKKSDVLLLLRPLAQALSDDDFNEALNLLQVRNLKYWVIWHDESHIDRQMILKRNKK